MADGFFKVTVSVMFFFLLLCVSVLTMEKPTQRVEHGSTASWRFMRRTWWTVLQLLASLYWRRLRRDVVTYNVDLAACQQSTLSCEVESIPNLLPTYLSKNP